MRFTDWLKPGIRVKRWLAFAILGILLIVFGIIELINRREYTVAFKIFYITLIVTGIFVIYLSAVEIMKSVIYLVGMADTYKAFKFFLKNQTNQDNLQAIPSLLFLNDRKSLQSYKAFHKTVFRHCLKTKVQFHLLSYYQNTFQNL